MPMLGTSIRRRFLVGGAITCLLLGILPGSAIARSGPSPAKHATDSGLTPIVLFPAWHFTRLTVTVKHQKTDPACPASGTFEDLVGEDPGPAFSQVCRDELLTLRYSARGHKPMRLRFSEQPGVKVTIADFGRTESAPTYEPMYEALEAAGYTRDKDIRVAGYDARLTPDMDGFLHRSMRLIEETSRQNGGRPVHLVGHSNGPIYVQYLLTHTSARWKARYIHGFTPLAGNFPGQGLGYALMFVGVNIPDLLFPATPENAVSSARMFLSHPSTFITASDPKIFGDQEVIIRDQSTGTDYTPQDWPQLFEDAGIPWAIPIGEALHRRRPVRRPGPLPERRRLRREGLRAGHAGRPGTGRPDDRPAGHRHDGVHHPRRRHQPGGPDQRRGRRVGRDGLLALQPDRQPGRDALRPAVRSGRARPAHRERQRTALGLLSGAPSARARELARPGTSQRFTRPPAISSSGVRRERRPTMRVFVAGANGAVGRRLVPMLVANGHRVTGSTTNGDSMGAIRAMGAEPVVVDGLDAVGIGQAVAAAEPEAIIHEMTALSGPPDFRHFDRWFALTNRLRTEGTDHLLAAAKASGVRRFVAQSFTGWSNIREGSLDQDRGGSARSAPGQRPARDARRDPLPRARRARGAARGHRGALRRAVRPGLVGDARRRSCASGCSRSSAAARASCPRPTSTTPQPARSPRWSAADAASTTSSTTSPRRPGCSSRRSPRRSGRPGRSTSRPGSGRLLAGEVAVTMMTEGRGSSNAKAKRELGWQPIWPSWRDGFRARARHARAAAAAAPGSRPRGSRRPRERA